MNYSYCVFRLDDITPAMNWQRFYQIKDIFDQQNVKPLIGVIPDNMDPKLNVSKPDPNFWRVIKDLEGKGWTIAQHGYQHLYVTKKSGMLKINKRSEFAGLTYSEQVEKILKGKKVLEDQQIYTDIFMAPAHSYDENTIEALKNCGFKYVTDGYSRYPYEYKGLKFIPCKHVRPKKTKGIVTSCLHSSTAKVELFAEVEKFIVDNRANVIDYSKALTLECRNSTRFFEGVYILHYQIIDSIPPNILHAIKKLIKS